MALSRETIASLLGLLVVAGLCIGNHYLMFEEPDNETTGDFLDVISPVGYNVLGYMKLMVWPWIIWMMLETLYFISRMKKDGKTYEHIIRRLATHVFGLCMGFVFIGLIYYMWQVDNVVGKHDLMELVPLFFTGLAFAFLMQMSLATQSTPVVMGMLALVAVVGIATVFGVNGGGDSSWWMVMHQVVNSADMPEAMKALVQRFAEVKHDDVPGFVVSLVTVLVLVLLGVGMLRRGWRQERERNNLKFMTARSPFDSGDTPSDLSSFPPF